MHAFEQLVSEILWMEGQWVRTAVKVDLTKDEKQRIGKPNSPRWELDVVAFQGGANILRVVECKSWQDAGGVRLEYFDPDRPELASRFKLFNDEPLREVVFERLRLQLAECGACPPNAEVRLCLACGNVVERHRAELRALFEGQGWELWDEPWLYERLKRVSDGGYENQVSAVVAKLLLRGAAE